MEDFFLKVRERVKKSKRKKQIKTLKNKKCRKWTDTSFPYRGTTRAKAIDEFLKLKKKMAKSDINPKSSIGNGLVDYGTEKARRKTKYRNKSFIELWNNKRRKKVIGFAKDLRKRPK